MHFELVLKAGEFRLNGRGIEIVARRRRLKVGWGSSKFFGVLPVLVFQKGVRVPSECAYLVGETSRSGQCGQRVLDAFQSFLLRVLLGLQVIEVAWTDRGFPHLVNL